MKGFTFIVAAAFSLMGLPCQADIYNYFSDSTLRLGGSFDPLDLNKVLPSCFDYDQETSVDAMGPTASASEVRFSIRQVRDSRELHTLLKTSVSAEGHYKMFSADGSSSTTSQLDVTSDATTWVLLASTDFGRFRAQNMRLNSVAQGLAKGSLSDFVERCGTEVTVQVKRGVSIAILFTLRNSSQTRSEETQQDFNASVGGQLWGVSASAEMNSKLKEVIEHGEIDLNIVGAGGSGAPGLSELVTQLKDSKTVEAAKTVLAAYIKSLGPERAAITEYQTGPISAFVQDLKAPEFSLFNQLVTEYFFAWQLNANWLSRLRDYLSGLSDETPSDRTDAEKAYQEIRARTFEIVSSARTCRNKYQTLVASLARRARSFRTPEQPSRLVDAINIQLASELQLARTGSPTTATLADDKKLLEAFGEEALAAGKRKCEFKTEWLNFSKYASLPRYPFADPVIWSDPLGQAPLNFLYARVEGKAIVSAKFINPQTRKDIAIFPTPPADSLKYEGLFDLTSDPSNRPIDLVVETKSGRRFSFRAWN